MLNVRAAPAIGLALALFTAACTSAPAASPTTAPSKVAEATKPAASPAVASPGAAASPAAKPGASPSPSPSPSLGASPSPAALAPATQAPAAQAPAAKPTNRERATVTIGARFSTVYLHFDLAKALGYYEDENLDIDQQYLAGGTQAATALLAGQSQFSGNSMDHIVKAKNEGKDMLLIASMTSAPGVTMVVNKKYENEIKTPADLKGKRIGVTAIGAGTHVLTLNVLARAGLGPNDAQIVPVGSDTMPAALEADQVHAAMGNDPYVSILKQENRAYFLVDFTTREDTSRYLGGDFQFTGLLTTADTVQSRPELVQRMTNAITRACQFMAGNSPREVAARLPKEVTGDNLDTYVLGLEHSYPALSKDCLATSSGVENFVQSQVVGGIITEAQKPNPADLFDMSFVQKAPRR